MEHAELITIVTLHGTRYLLSSPSSRRLISYIGSGRPSTIKPGKPVYKWVFERLVNGERLLSWKCAMAMELELIMHDSLRPCL